MLLTYRNNEDQKDQLRDTKAKNSVFLCPILSCKKITKMSSFPFLSNILYCIHVCMCICIGNCKNLSHNNILFMCLTHPSTFAKKSHSPSKILYNQFSRMKVALNFIYMYINYTHTTSLLYLYLYINLLLENFSS